jgi:hypothetical protein
MKKLIVMATMFGAALLPAAASARQPSDACSAGEVPPSASPLGIGVRQAGDPYQEPTTIYACSTGAVAPGAVRLRSDGSGQSLVLDGDDDNDTLACSDGYAAVRLGTDGPHLYRSGDGDYTSAARERTPQEIADGASRDCLAG